MVTIAITIRHKNNVERALFDKHKRVMASLPTVHRLSIVYVDAYPRSFCQASMVHGHCLSLPVVWSVSVISYAQTGCILPTGRRKAAKALAISAYLPRLLHLDAIADVLC